MNSTTFEFGNNLLYKNYEEGIQAVMIGLKDISPHIGRYIIETFGQAFRNPILTHKQREMITISVLTSLGDCVNQLNWHINFGLRVGLSANEIVEIFTHCIPFSGFPRTLNAIAVAKEVFANQKINVFVEDEFSSIGEKRERGLKKLAEIDGNHGKEVIQSLSNISPSLGDQIIDFTFGEVYSRSVLNPKQRQLVTLGSLTAQGGCEPQLKVHINASLRVGLSKEEIIEALLQTSPYTGFPKVLNSISVAKRIFDQVQ